MVRSKCGVLNARTVQLAVEDVEVLKLGLSGEREVILRNLPSPSEDIAQKKKWVIDRQVHRLPVWWAIYIFGFDFNIDIGAYSQVLTKFVVMPRYKSFLRYYVVIISKFYFCSSTVNGIMHQMLR